MKRLVLGIYSILLCTVLGASVQAANVNDFTITRYDIDYELSRDEDGRSRLSTTETITARFPDFDQNHGIERAIPKSYDNHSTSLSIQSVTKPDGSKLQYSTRTENDNEIIRVGDPDEYVRGLQTYVIKYTQRDVTKSFANVDADEFYWDTNGTDWNVAIDRLVVRLSVDESVASELNAKSACYQGISGSTGTCELNKNEATYETTAFNLRAGQNVTIAVGFNEGTFAQYEQSVFEKMLQIWIVLTIIIGAAALLFIVGLTHRWYAWSSRKHDRGTVIAEYLPPKDASVAASASIFTPKGSVFTAQLLDFAVRHYIQIYQTKEKSFWKPAQYDVKIIKDISSLKAEEQEVLRDIFQGATNVDSRLSLDSLKNNTAVYKKVSDNDGKLKKLIREDYGLRARVPQQSVWFKRTGFVLLAAAVLLLNPVLLVASVCAFGFGATLWPLTDKGLKLHTYLEGLKEYIKVAEADRLAMLQSPEGALKVDSKDVNDPAERIKLYERVLPYAVLFGQEKEWSKRIGELYESAGTSPDWYSGNGTVFNAAVFSSAMSGFSTAASYSAASSSSSGGSSGGGSSGGGGGGGGGGGW